VTGWSWRLTPPAERDVKRLDKLVANYPRGDVVRLKGVTPPEFRLRVGDWRVRFRADSHDRVVFVLRVLPRGEAYR
jgi:mRNA-degrading endonuclease RelE of RelBE toxin-antitoxin system